ncbi:MAG: hypothetical protein DYG94_01405 [Leptolyngbya sp. PLA3]|nr:MAG: hypothetical protein EDM82_00475 [Cyanobacteria bacterium CYA]MCE7967388.1 hypothetical protein [Leptolyngbya sp. PL-A3]
MRAQSRLGWILAGGTILASLGCVGYSSYPKVEGGAPSSPNFIHMRPVIAESLKAVIEKYHPQDAGPYAVNLPIGITETGRDEVMKALGAQAMDLTPRTEHLPIYHVGRVWVRGADAKVDIVRPILELGRLPGGQPTYQGVTVWLDGGINNWWVEMIQPWSIGVVEPPELHYVVEHPPEESSRDQAAPAEAGAPPQEPRE